MHGGNSFRLHPNLIPADDPELEGQRRFRDALRADPALVVAYARCKRDVLAAGAVDGTAYNCGNEAFMRLVMSGEPTAAVVDEPGCRR